MKRARITEELAYGTALDRLTGRHSPAAPPEPVVSPTPPGPPPPEPVEPPTPPGPPKKTMIKLSVFLHREEDAYLEDLASTAKFSGGKKLSKTKLIEAMVRAFRKTGLDVRGVRTDEELRNRVIAQLRH